MVESELINPLSRIIIVQQPPDGTVVYIKGTSPNGELDVDIKPVKEKG